MKNEVGIHTPTPWYISGETNKFGQHLIEIKSDIDGVSGSVVYVHGHPEQALTDAEFIIKVVNSHNSLLDYAKKYRVYLEMERERINSNSSIPAFQNKKYIAVSEELEKVDHNINQAR